jgi:hypothetical protein
MLLLFSIAYQFSDGSMGRMLKTTGSDSIEVFDDGIFVFKDPKQVKQGDIIRVLHQQPQKARVVEVAYHDYRWNRVGDQHLVNIAARRDAGKSDVQMSLKPSHPLWCSVNRAPVQKLASEIRVGDIVWSDLDQGYAQVFYTNN